MMHANAKDFGVSTARALLLGRKSSSWDSPQRNVSQVGNLRVHNLVSAGWQAKLNALRARRWFDVWVRRVQARKHWRARVGPIAKRIKAGRRYRYKQDAFNLWVDFILAIKRERMQKRTVHIMLMIFARRRLREAWEALYNFTYRSRIISACTIKKQVCTESLRSDRHKYTQTSSPKNLSHVHFHFHNETNTTTPLNDVPGLCVKDPTSFSLSSSDSKMTVASAETDHETENRNSENHPELLVHSSIITPPSPLSLSPSTSTSCICTKLHRMTDQNTPSTERIHPEDETRHSPFLYEVVTKEQVQYAKPSESLESQTNSFYPRRLRRLREEENTGYPLSNSKTISSMKQEFPLGKISSSSTQTRESPKTSDSLVKIHHEQICDVLLKVLNTQKRRAFVIAFRKWRLQTLLRRAKALREQYHHGVKQL